MAKLWLDHSDGRYSVRELTDEEAARRDYFDVVHLPDTVWEAYLRHCDRDATWQMLWQSISNEQYMRRREKELLPLEDAKRKISQLESDLAQARRMGRYFEEEHDRAKGLDPDRWHTAEARSDNGYTCVFPQPNCDVKVLSSKWRARAAEIVGAYRTDLGTKYQGCCCAYDDHEKLDEAAVQKLRDSGFLVEQPCVDVIDAPALPAITSEDT